MGADQALIGEAGVRHTLAPLWGAVHQCRSTRACTSDLAGEGLSRPVAKAELGQWEKYPFTLRRPTDCSFPQQLVVPAPLELLLHQ